MNQLNNLNESLKYLIDLGRDLRTLTGNDDQKLPGYWTKTLDEFSAALTNKNITCYDNTNYEGNQCYEDRKTPEHQRFPGIRSKFLEIYEIEEDQLNQEFMILQSNGKKKVNDGWLRINKNIEYSEFCNENFHLPIKENSGYNITIKKYSPEEKRRGHVDVELPISSLYRAAIYIDNKGSKNPRYPYAVIYGIYNCFKYSVPQERLSPHILEIINDIYSRKEILLEKEKTKLSAAMETVKKSIGPLINSNRESIQSLTSQIENGLTDLDDNKIDEVAEQCHNAIEMFTENSQKDLSQVIGSMISADEEKVKSTMERFGFSENNIRSIIDNKTGAMTNEELRETLKINEIDEILKSCN